MNTNGCPRHAKYCISRKNIWYLDQNNLHASVHHWAFPSDIFNHLLNSELDVKISSFLPTAGLLFDDKWKYVVIAGALLQCLASPCVHGCPQGGQNGNLPPPGNWDKEPKISRKPEVSRLIDLILAMTVYFPIWHSYCTRTLFTVVVSCNFELAIHSCLLQCLQRQVAKLGCRQF